MRRSTPQAACALVLGLLAGGACPAAAAPASLPSVSSGHRPGPDILYAPPPPTPPQLQNVGLWQADPILVSGATAYRSGEFIYQDFLYDDHGAAGTPDPEDPFTPADFLFSPRAGTLTYPSDPVFGGNAADLVELRVTRLAGATAFRLTLNTLRDPARTAFTIALGDSGEPRAWPHGAGVRSPAELFLTVHGGEAELRDAATGESRSPAPTVAVDAHRRQIEVRIPHAAWSPGSGAVRLAAGVGLWDTDAGTYLAPRGSHSDSVPGGASPGGAALFNLAFRMEEPLPDVSNALAGVTIADAAAGARVDSTWWRERAQSAALAEGDVSAFSARVDFAKLGKRTRRMRARRRIGRCGSSCRRRVRLRLPRRTGLSIVRVGVRHRGKVLRRVRGRDLRRIVVRRTTRRAFTLRLRIRARGSDLPDDNSGVPRTGPISRILPSRYQFGQGVDFGKLCGGISHSSPCDGFHVGQLQPYGLYVPRGPRPGRGFGFTLLLHSLSANYNQYMASRNQSQLGERGGGSIVATPSGRGPDGFYEDVAEADTFEVWADVARNYRLDPEWTVVSGYSMGGIGTYRMLSRWPDLFARGMSTVGYPDDSRERLPSLRNTPIMTWAASADELVNVAFTEQAVSDLTSHGLRFEAALFETADHLTLATNDEYGPAAAFLGEHRVDRNPPHVTFVVDPEADSARAQVVADHAYWLSGLRVRDPEAGVGTIDVRSEGFGVGDPAPLEVRESNRVLEGGARGPMPYLHRQLDWGPTPEAPRADRLVVEATNVASATIDARRARVSCKPQIVVRSDGPIDLRVACPR